MKDHSKCQNASRLTALDSGGDLQGGRPMRLRDMFRRQTNPLWAKAINEAQEEPTPDQFFALRYPGPKPTEPREFCLAEGTSIPDGGRCFCTNPKDHQPPERHRFISPRKDLPT